MSYCNPPGRTAVVLIVPFLALLLTQLHLLAATPAESTEYKSTNGMYTMTAHFRWCGEAKSSAARLARYEKFWELQAPEQSDGYDDTLHVRTVRRCAYRLAQLYAELGQKKNCAKMLDWLEKEDDSFKIEKE